MLHVSALERHSGVFELLFVRAEDFPAQLLLLRTTDDRAFRSSFSSEDGTTPTEEGDGSLNEAAETERDYVRRRLRDELGREPSEEEVDEWLRRHTEGY
jgi:hypothetical protein